MLKFLSEILKLVGKSKFLNFLIEVFKDLTGVVLDDSYKIINEVVLNVENIAQYIVDNTTYPNEQLTAILINRYGYDISIFDVFEIKKNKSVGKFLLARKLIKKRLISERKKFVGQSINLGIELAVSRFFSKKWGD